MKRSLERFRLVLDTNILFSAIRYKGKPFELLEKAEKEGIKILIPEYVLEELKIVFERNEIDFLPVRAFLDTYTNIKVIEREFRKEHVELAEKHVPDRKDRPVFIYTLILREEYPKTYLVTGDKKLRESINKFEKGFCITVDEALELVLR